MAEPLKLIDLHPAASDLCQEVLDGLGSPQKQLPAKLFYDERGSKLFDQITQLDEYYVTRTELEIMHTHIGAMVSLIGSSCVLFEYGSGSSEKIRILLDHLDEPAAYVPIDISRDHLMRSAAQIARAYPDLDVIPVCADYETPFTLPPRRRPSGVRVVYFPGSTIGNFHPRDAVAFLRRFAGLAGERGAVLIGVDTKKDPDILNAAYNDSRGITAAFNLNMLRHLNTQLGTNFDLAAFEHRAFYNEGAGRIEMHLVSTRAQTVTVDGQRIAFAAGESIWTESSYKYSITDFAKMAQSAGLEQRAVWQDDRGLFSVHYLTVAAI